MYQKQRHYKRQRYRRRNIDDGRETNAMFLVDKMTNETPGPGSYEVKSITPMDMNGGKFTGRRYGPFQTTSGPIHISHRSVLCYSEKVQFFAL
jgi:hypothetical protein